MFVYAFIVNDECIYVGSTKNMSDRLKVHKCDSKTSHLELYKAINEIGWDAVEIKIISENPEWNDDDLKIEERKQIGLLNPKYNLYRPYRTDEEKIVLVSESKKKCYDAKKEEYLAVNKIYREAHKEEIAAKRKIWLEANREALLAKKKEYREAKKAEINAKQKEKRDADKEAYNAKQREKREANKEVVNERRRLAYAEKKKAQE